MMETKNGRLFFDGCDVTELAKKYGTPLYVYSQTAIERRFDELRRDFLDRWPGSRVAYAAKAFCTTGMCRLVERAGMCVDVVSGGELYTARHAGFPMDRVFFHGNNKTDSELLYALRENVGLMIVDNDYELERLNRFAGEMGKCLSLIHI